MRAIRARTPGLPVWSLPLVVLHCLAPVSFRDSPQNRKLLLTHRQTCLPTPCNGAVYKINPEYVVHVTHYRLLGTHRLMRTRKYETTCAFSFTSTPRPGPETDCLYERCNAQEIYPSAQRSVLTTAQDLERETSFIGNLLVLSICLRKSLSGLDYGENTGRVRGI